MDGNTLCAFFFFYARVSHMFALVSVSAVRMGEQPAFAAPDHVADTGKDRVALVATAGQLIHPPSKGPVLISTLNTRNAHYLYSSPCFCAFVSCCPAVVPHRYRELCPATSFRLLTPLSVHQVLSRALMYANFVVYFMPCMLFTEPPVQQRPLVSAAPAVDEDEDDFGDWDRADVEPAGMCSNCNCLH